MVLEEQHKQQLMGIVEEVHHIAEEEVQEMHHNFVPVDTAEGVHHTVE
jgi:hypothetical protein